MEPTSSDSRAPMWVPCPDDAAAGAGSPIGCDDLAGGRASIEGAARRAGVADGRAADVALVASELLSNACEHGHDGHVAVVRTAAGVELRVTNAAARGSVPPPARWTFPTDPLAPSGRGLAIVARLASAVRLHWDDDRVTVTAVFPVAEPHR